MSRMADFWRQIRRPLLIGLLVVAVVSLAQWLLASRLAEQAQREALAPLHDAAGGLAFDNDPLADAITLVDARLGPGPQQLYPLRWNGTTRAHVVSATAAEGYGGDLSLLIGIAADGTVLGVRVRRHGETAGLGDRFTGVDWLHGFSGQSLADPPTARWRVRRDGGDFDHVTGATITPRAIVDAVRRALEWHAADGSRYR